MKLIFIGTGNSMLDQRRGMPCIALCGNLATCENAEGVFLLDAGSGTVHSCLQYGIELKDLRGILVTHFHVDHLLDLIQILWLRHIHRSIEGPLFVAGPRGTARLIASVQGIFSIGTETPWLRLKEVDPEEEFEAGWMRVRAFKSFHTEESLCYRIESGGKALCYSGDSGPCESLVRACAGTDLAVLECTYPGPSPVASHMGPADCAVVAEKAGAKRLALTHLPAGVDPAELVSKVATSFKGRCTVAEDFMEMEV